MLFNHETRVKTHTAIFVSLFSFRGTRGGSGIAPGPRLFGCCSMLLYSFFQQLSPFLSVFRVPLHPSSNPYKPLLMQFFQRSLGRPLFFLLLHSDQPISWFTILPHSLYTLFLSCSLTFSLTPTLPFVLL